MIVHNLFPIPVGQFKLPRELTESEISFVKNQKTHKNMGNKTSDDSRLFENRELKEIADFCQQSVDEYLKRIYAPRNDVSLYFTQSWGNYTEPGQFHHKHAHPNSFVSGVFYISTDPEHDKIFFYKERFETLKLPTEQFNLYNSDSWWFPVAAGDLYLFPSNLTHMVETTQSADTRVSIAFNTFLKGYIGQDDHLTGLHL